MFDVFMLIINIGLLALWAGWFAQKVGWLKSDRKDTWNKYVYLFFIIISIYNVIFYTSTLAAAIFG